MKIQYRFSGPTRKTMHEFYDYTYQPEERELRKFMFHELSLDTDEIDYQLEEERIGEMDEWVHEEIENRFVHDAYEQFREDYEYNKNPDRFLGVSKKD